MADKTITFTRSLVAQKDISEGDNTANITQLSKPIILKGVSTKTCQNVLYSIDGMNFTEETTIGDDNVLSMAIVPFWLGASDNITNSMVLKAFSYILGERNINEDINIDNPISTLTDFSKNANGAYILGESNIDRPIRKATNSPKNVNGAYRYLLQYLAKNKDKIEWNTGDLFSTLDADKQDSFGGSDFITDKISVEHANYVDYHLAIDIQKAANGSILKPKVRMLDTDSYSNNITIEKSPYFFLYPEACPPSDGDPDKLIIDNFWRGGGLLAAGKLYQAGKWNGEMFMLYIFAVS